LLRLPTAILVGHEILDTVSIGTHDYQNSLASLIAPEIEVHPVGPEIRVAPSREIPLKPPGMILTPVVLQGLTAPRESPLASVSGGGRTLGNPHPDRTNARLNLATRQKAVVNQNAPTMPVHTARVLTQHFFKIHFHRNRD
jgi:hypothetical protein